MTETNKKFNFAFAVCGSLMTILLFVFINFYTSPHTLWFIYPAFAVIWWPLSIFFGHGGSAKPYSIAAFMLITVFFIVVNYTSSPSVPWFIFPVYGAAWWPLALLTCGRDAKAVSVTGSLLSILFFVLVNILFSPACPWCLYVIPALILWPVMVLLGQKSFHRPYSTTIAVLVCLCYIALNLTIGRGFPWSLFIIYAMLWLPAVSVLARRHGSMAFSLFGSISTSILFIIVNIVSTPHVIWAVYPVFAVVWWPLSIYFFVYKKSKSY